MEKIIGLSTTEVQQRIDNQQINITPKPVTKTTLQIIFGHLFNLFNFYNFVIALLLIIAQAYTSLFFILIVLGNTFIRINQDIKSRNMVTKLNLIVSPKTKVIRNGEIMLIDNDQIVLDDIVLFETGNQISSDSKVVSNQIEVDESLISGEADPVLKKPGDQLLSGSFVVSGTCYARVIHVGNNNYASRITEEARNRKPVSSELINTFNRVTRFTSFFIIPIGIMMLIQAFIFRNQPFNQAIINSSTALMGMLPKGLPFLTTITLSASVVRLGKKKTLVQELYSIETLARIDTICLDKTGTLTEGNMSVEDYMLLNNTSKGDFEELMSAYVNACDDNNSTFQTLNGYFKKDIHYEVLNRISFSSARKWGAIEFKNKGTLIVGAAEFIKPDFQMPIEIENKRREGKRILLVSLTQTINDAQDHLNKSTPIGLIMISDPIRCDAKETINFFKQNNVRVKVISGDNPETVNAIAKEAGLITNDHFVDATTLKDDESIFDAIEHFDIIGRATPYQKHKMILHLQLLEHKVAMTGDGVNDVLALKDADVSIAMGSGSDAAKQIAQVIIIDGQLKTLIDIVKEGRIDINSITRSASMYYLKTIYTIGLAIMAIALNIPYPFIPFQMTLIDMFIEGFPSFMLIFQPDISKPKFSIKDLVIRFSAPNAIAIIVVMFAIQIFSRISNLNQTQIYTMSYYTLAFTSFYMIYRIYKPLNFYRIVVLILDLIGFFISIPIFYMFLEIGAVTSNMAYVMAILMIISIVIIQIISLTIQQATKMKELHK